MPKFKVGDKVRYVRGASAVNLNTDGVRGKIKQVTCDGFYLFEDGSITIHLADEAGGDYELELVDPSPIREVTTRALIDGAYGIVGVLSGRVEIDRYGPQTPADLRAAAKTLTEIADYLESQSAAESAH